MLRPRCALEPLQYKWAENPGSAVVDHQPLNKMDNRIVPVATPPSPLLVLGSGQLTVSSFFQEAPQLQTARLVLLAVQAQLGLLLGGLEVVDLAQHEEQELGMPLPAVPAG